MKNFIRISALALVVAASFTACKGKSSGNAGDSTTAVATPDTAVKKGADTTAAKGTTDTAAKKTTDTAAKKK